MKINIVRDFEVASREGRLRENYNVIAESVRRDAAISS